MRLTGLTLRELLDEAQAGGYGEIAVSDQTIVFRGKHVVHGGPHVKFKSHFGVDMPQRQGSALVRATDVQVSVPSTASTVVGPPIAAASLVPAAAEQLAAQLATPVELHI